MNIEEIQAIFFQECEEGLNEMETAFAEIRPDSYDVETINTVFRAVHSIKGGAGAFGHERLQAFTHEYETLLDYLRNGTLSLDQSVLDTVLAAFDLLSDHVAAALLSSVILGSELLESDQGPCAILCYRVAHLQTDSLRDPSSPNYS